jgi:hypothetical protein
MKSKTKERIKDIAENVLIVATLFLFHLLITNFVEQ